jgi:hypothetical protein
MLMRSIRTKRAVVMAGLVVSLCLSAAVVKRYRASAAGGALGRAAEARNVVAPAPNLVSQPAPAPHSALPAAQASPTPADPQVQVITLGPTGFVPSSVTLNLSTFVLAVNNRSGVQSIMLELAAQNSGQSTNVASAPVVSSNPGWRTLLNLSPGQYMLTEASHPQWTCQITITSS